MTRRAASSRHLVKNEQSTGYIWRVPENAVKGIAVQSVIRESCLGLTRRFIWHGDKRTSWCNVERGEGVVQPRPQAASGGVLAVACRSTKLGCAFHGMPAADRHFMRLPGRLVPAEKERYRVVESLNVFACLAAFTSNGLSPAAKRRRPMRSHRTRAVSPVKLPPCLSTDSPASCLCSYWLLVAAS